MSLNSPRRVLALATAAVCMIGAAPNAVFAQAVPTGRDLSIAGDLRGRTVEAVRVSGNSQVLTATILNVVRTREGDKFDPQTVQEDYQRVFGLRQFANVEAKVEPTATGVIVVFEVTEQRQIREIEIRKPPSSIDDPTIRGAIDVQKGQAIDPFRIAQAKRAIADLYRGRNFPFATVDVDLDSLRKTGVLTFDIVEGPQVRVRNIAFKGNRSFSDGKLKDKIRTATWIWLLRDGQFSPDIIEDDVAAIRKFYNDKGFFDARVGRRLVFSPDRTEMQVEFLIDEGQRYLVDQVTFKGNANIDEAKLRQELKIVEGSPYDEEIVTRDIRKIVRDYSPLGYIYEPGSNDPDYLRIEPRTLFKREAGRVELVYEITEGKPFRIGQILPRGNTRTQDKVVLRELRMAPGELYDAGKIQDANERLRGTPYFSNVKLTPIGTDADQRDLLVEVEEARTATLTFGAGINSNGGVAGNITYTQKNFDITNWPRSFSDLGGDKSFVGAGQTLRLSFEPGTTATNASIRFTEPYLLDQPYSLTVEAYLRNRQREYYNDDRFGGRVSFGHRFNDFYSAAVGLRLEQIDINSIEDKPIRAFEILEEQGEHALTSVTLSGRRDTTTGGLLPSKGTKTEVAWESVGLLGGDYSFQRLSLSHDRYYTLFSDLIDRKTILAFHGDAGYIVGDAPFFERFYAGGINSIRGFSFRGVTPRSGPADDRIGGDFSVTGSAEVSYPLYEEVVRGVVFTDVGTVQSDLEVGTIRSSIGTGVRITLPFLGQVPIAIDIALPLTKDKKDDVQILSFSLGFVP